MSRKEFNPDDSNPTADQESLKQYISRVETPLLRAVHREYGRFACGPSSIALSHLVAEQLHIPIRQGTDDVGHLALTGALFSPPPDSPHKPLDHTYIRYYNGDLITYIDPVYTLLWGDRQPEELDGAVTIVDYPKDEIDEALQANYYIRPFSPELASSLDIDFGGVPPTDLDFRDVMSAMNDERALQPNSFTADSGRVIPSVMWGDRIVNVMREVTQAL